MKKLLCSFLFSSRLLVNAQPIVTDGNNQRILNWDSTYQIQSTGFTGIEKYIKLDYQYIVKKDGNRVAEYLRHDDSSYLFVNYDTAGKQNKRGLLKISKDVFNYETVMIPDVSKDPTFEKAIFKDTVITNISYRKNGQWKETDNIGNIWVGKYENGNREGVWEKGVNFFDPHTSANAIDVMFDNFRPLSRHLFQRGQEIANFKEESFWPKIKGEWCHEKILDSNTCAFQKTSFSRPLFNFATDKLFTSYRKPLNTSYFDVIEQYTASWKQNGNLIEISADGKTKLLQVLSITDDRLILKFIKW